MKTYKEASMNKLISLAILAVVSFLWSLALLRQSHSVLMFLAFSPAHLPTRRLWMLVGGVVVIVSG
jgi:hypothetical protein